MIHGHKPNGYFRTFNAHGNHVEGETRQCIHCQTMWTYRPGSGIERGWCLNCGGFICAQPECLVQQKDLIEKYFQLTSRVRTCMPFQEWNERLREKLEKKFPLEPGLTVTDSGLIVPSDLAG